MSKAGRRFLSDLKIKIEYRTKTRLKREGVLSGSITKKQPLGLITPVPLSESVSPKMWTNDGGRLFSDISYLVLEVLFSTKPPKFSDRPGQRREPKGIVLEPCDAALCFIPDLESRSSMELPNSAWIVSKSACAPFPENAYEFFVRFSGGG